MGKTSHASFHCTMRGFSGRRGAGIFKVVVVLFTIVSSPSRRDLAKTARPPLCVLRDTARHRRWPPRGTLAAWLRALPGRRTPGAASSQRNLKMADGEGEEKEGLRISSRRAARGNVSA